MTKDCLKRLSFTAHTKYNKLDRDIPKGRGYIETTDIRKLPRDILTERVYIGIYCSQ